MNYYTILTKQIIFINSLFSIRLELILNLSFFLDLLNLKMSMFLFGNLWERSGENG